MRLRPGAATAVFALLLPCLCEAAKEARWNATIYQVNATQTQQLNETDVEVNTTETMGNETTESTEMAEQALQNVVRWVRRVLHGGDYRYPGSDVGLEGSDADYLLNEERTFRGNTYRDLEDNRIRGFTVLRNKDFGNTKIASETTDEGLAADTRDRVFTPETRDRGFIVNTRNSGYAPESRDRGLTRTPDMRNTQFAPEPKDFTRSPDIRNTEFVPETKNRGFISDTLNTEFAPETMNSGFTRSPDMRNTQASETRDRGFAPDTGNREFAPATSDSGFTRDAENRGFAPATRDRDAIKNIVSGAEQGFETVQKQPYAYNFRGNEGINGNGQTLTGTVMTDFGARDTRDFDLSRGVAGRRFGQNQSMSSAGQRWLRILAEFLKASPEGRELLREQAGQLLEGVDLAAGELPRPVLLLPVPVQDQGSELRPVEENNDFHRTLLALFQQAQPSAPMLPPLLLPTSPRPVPAAPLPLISSAPPSARLHFDRSLIIRADLTVFYSDYTEPYTVWYDADTGSSRVDMHGGTTVLYRSVRPGGDVQRVQFRIERFGDDEMRRCTWLTTRAVDADRALPGLPDPAPFSFTGYQDTVDGRMERWTYSLAGQAGELGAARGEALVFRHELLVARVEPDFAIPYKYRVAVDSSVLGPEADWYEHRYLEVREQRPDAAHLSIDVERACDALQRAHRVDQVDPLREFVMTHRDSRCDADFEKFKETHQINYEDPVDEAVRKTLLIRSTRFVESANRQGATAEMANSAIGVMLPAEQRLLRGIRPDRDTPAGNVTEGSGGAGGDSGQGAQEGTGGDSGEGDEEGEGEGVLGAVPKGFGVLEPLPFPFSTQDVKRMAAQLQEAFSWKRQGGVTHIRNQGYCTSCWAFAVVCAVEGALFQRTRKLVPLSDKQLADCTRSRRSCDETGFVRSAYLQAKNGGILALSDYEPYMYKNPKLEQCKKKEPVVTKINGFVKVPSNNTDAVKVAIVMNGPVVVEVDSLCGGFKFFKSGVLRDMRCDPDRRNHAVAAIGYSRHKTIGDYFIIKNSWGVAGNDGYVHLHADSNTAGVLTAPTYPVLDEGNIVNRSRLDSLARTFSDEPSIYKTDGEAEYMAFLKQQKEYLDKNPEVQTLRRRK